MDLRDLLRYFDGRLQPMVFLMNYLLMAARSLLLILLGHFYPTGVFTTDLALWLFLIETVERKLESKQSNDS